MKAIARWLDRFCYNHPNFGIPNLVKFIVIGNVLVYFLDMFSRGYASYALMFYTPWILQGEVWRIVTFIFVPTSGYNPSDMLSVLWFAMSLLFCYYIGNALERQWGTARFTVFYGLGVVLNIIVGFVMGSTSMYYINMSMFFAFATLYPEMQVLLMGILPLKVKWLAWIEAALFAYGVFFSLASPAVGHRRAAPGGLLNYFIFFWGRPDGHCPPHQPAGLLPRQSPDHQLQKGTEAGAGAQGLPSTSAPCAALPTRTTPTWSSGYCSKCNGYYCYCMKHINNHVHVQ